MSIRSLLLAFLCLPAASLLAEFQLIEGFDLLNPGNISGQDQWYATAGTAEVVADPADVTNQVMAVSTNSGLVRYPMTVPNGEARMMFFRFRFGIQQKYSIGLSPHSSPSEFSDFATEVGMANESNDLHVWDDDVAPNYVELDTLDQAHWYNVWVYTDNANDQYQVWVNDGFSYQALPTDQLADGDNDSFDFRLGGASDLIRFYIKTGGGGAPGAPDGPVYLDDVYLEAVDGVLNLHNPLRLVGDVTGDGFVGLADLDIVLHHWNQNVTPYDLLSGDLTGDGYVGLADLDAVLGSWNTGTPPTSSVAIPEPASAVLMLTGLASLTTRRRAFR